MAIWFDQLPKDWVARRIKTISPVMRGASPRPIDDPAYFDDDGEFAWVRISDVTASNGKLFATTQRLSSLGASKSVKLNPGRLFLSIAGSVGKPCVTGVKACIHDGFVYFPFMKQDSQKFMYYIFEGGACFAGLGKLGTQLNLNTETVGNIEIPFPPPEIQRSIADFLDCETARIDLLIEKKQRFLQVARERWQATLNHAVFPNSPYWSRLPFGWRKIHLKYLTDPKRPIMYGIVLPGPNMEEGPMIVKGGDVKPGRLNPDRLCRTTAEIEASYTRSRLKAGDLVISIRGGIGDIEIVPPEIEGANLTQDAARIAPRTGVDREWLRYALLSSAVFHPLEARSLGAAVRGINIFDLKRVYVPEPPQDLQTEIADYLRRQEGNLLRLRLKVERHTELLREFRAALITAAVTGQIDVETWGKLGQTDRRLEKIEEALHA